MGRPKAVNQGGEISPKNPEDRGDLLPMREMASSPSSVLAPPLNRLIYPQILTRCDMVTAGVYALRCLRCNNWAYGSRSEPPSHIR
ncbi:hypothetical protein TNCV_3148101 [Trichonephila clavipes]|nr:hypothetical protein TNCV_3148101 [Trichonephila clavipes]